MPQISIGQDTKMNSGLVLEYQTISASTYAMTSTSGAAGGFDYAIGCDTSSNAITITLPTTSANGMELGRMYYIFDKAGNANSNNIIIDAGTNAKINTAQTLVIDAAYNSVTLMCVDVTTDAEIWIVV